MTSAIEIRGLVRRFDGLEAVAGIDCTIEQGEIFGFLGPNGAGQVDDHQHAVTLLKPTGGATVNGFDVRASRTTCAARSASSSRTRRSTSA